MSGGRSFTSTLHIMVILIEMNGFSVGLPSYVYTSGREALACISLVWDQIKLISSTHANRIKHKDFIMTLVHHRISCFKQFVLLLFDNIEVYSAIRPPCMAALSLRL